jgi:hypothetical protein
MSGSSIFITYGLKSGGGVPFLRRTRNAFGQLQTRTRTGTTSSFSCNCGTAVTNAICAYYSLSGWTCRRSPTNNSCDYFGYPWSCYQYGTVCQTCTSCSFGNFTEFSNVASCTPETPGCSNGALQRECQTEFSFREEDWSPFEEAETCDPVSPTPADGAVEVECIAN